MKFLGTIARAIGVNGEILITDLPTGEPYLLPGTKVYIGYSENFTQTYTFTEWRHHNKGAVIALKEIEKKEQTDEVKEKGVFVEEENLNFWGERRYSEDDLEGFTVIDEAAKQEIGKIVEVWLLTANDVWIVETEKGDLPVPVIDDVIKRVDFKRKTVEIEIIEGLIDLVEENDEEDKEEQ